METSSDQVNDAQPRICHVATGVLVDGDRVLMIRHKKLSVWLSPGGHVEPGELPHFAAEREFWEETGVRVKAYDPDILRKPGMELVSQLSSQNLHIIPSSTYLPAPFSANIHWFNKDRYEARMSGKLEEYSEKHQESTRECELHFNSIYLVRATDGFDFHHNIEEVDDIGWVDKSEIALLDTFPDVRLELLHALDVAHFQV